MRYCIVLSAILAAVTSMASAASTPPPTGQKETLSRDSVCFSSQIAFNAAQNALLDNDRDGYEGAVNESAFRLGSGAVIKTLGWKDDGAYGMVAHIVVVSGNVWAGDDPDRQYPLPYVDCWASEI